MARFGQAMLGSGYAGLYRLDETQPFEMVTDPVTGRALIFSTSIEAVRAAKDFVQRLVEPQRETPPQEPDILGVDAWRAEKANDRAFSEIIRRTGEMRPFEVERRRRRKVVKP